MTRTVAVPDLARIAKRAGQDIDGQVVLNLVKRAMLPEAKQVDVVEQNQRRFYLVVRQGLGPLITKMGTFWHYVFTINDTWQKYSVLVRAEIDKETLLPIFRNTGELILRTDSGCETGQVFGDLTCDCHEQLELAMSAITRHGEGMIINIPHQDGRGMGLSFKLATLWLQQELKIHTVESAGLLAPNGIIDVRTYAGVVAILKFFGINEKTAINLATNNPHKAEVFAENGYNLTDYIPVVAKPTKHTRRHLRAKQKHLGHRDLVKPAKRRVRKGDRK